MSDNYEDYRDRQARISRERSATGREIGPLPAVANPRRVGRCSKSLRKFCETYLPGRFPLAWSPSHLAALARLQTCATQGGQFALAMPRAQGKTTLCEAAALWALLYGHRRFVLLIGATEQAAEEVLASIKVELESNDLLADDFPAVTHPIRSLEGIANRANGQTVDGQRTRIQWTQKEIVLPTVKGSKSSGAVLRVAGLTGRVRGQRATCADGTTIRPDLAIVDDPQTDESARSPTQNATRERLLCGAVLGLAGPKQRIAVVCPCTVIAPGDLADRILDRDRYPEWQGERTRLLISPPAAEGLWDEYARIRAEGQRSGAGTAAATDYYRQHRAEMDAGAEVSWPERYLPDQLSAVQYAMDLRIDNPAAFQAEYQNDPWPEGPQSCVEELTADQVAAKLNRLKPGFVPRDATRLTCGVDVQARCLFWLVAAWGEDYGGGIVACGAWPRQNRAYYSAADARPDLAERFPDLAESARLYAALGALLDELLQAWPREEGAPALIERVLIDANWGASTDTVYQFCRQTAHKALVLPSHGRGIGASAVPMRDWPRKPGERRGLDWVIPPPAQGRGRHVTFDANSWKTFVAERLRTPAGAPGCLYLPGDRPHDHQLLADHLTAEYRVRTSGRGREVDEWRLRPERSDNHWLDCLVLAAVAASVQGLGWSPSAAAGQPVTPPPPRKPVKWSEVQKQRAAERKGAR